MPTRTVTFSGPWSGIEERENFQSENSAQISLNVDYSRGYIEARPGTECIAHILASTTGSEGDKAYHYRPQIHISRPMGSPNRILSVSVNHEPSNPAHETNKIFFVAFDLSGNPLGGLQDLTTDLGEPADKDFRCSFIDCVLEDNGVPQYVTVVSTKYNTYVYNPLENQGSLRKLSIAQDAFHDLSAEMSYWADPPFGSIAVRHQQSYWFSGIKDLSSVQVTSPLESDQNAIIETWLSAGRGEVFLTPEYIYYSMVEKVADMYVNDNIVTEIGERVTGMASFMQSLIIFSDSGIYTVTAVDKANFMPVKVVSGIGCVAPDSIVQAGDALYFMGPDGIYGFTGSGMQGTAVKVSGSIDSMFSGKMDSSFVPNYTHATAINYGWPWHIDKTSLSLSQGLHVRSKEQIWWSIPLKGGNSKSFLATLVFDYAKKAWSIYATAEVDDATPRSLFFSGDTINVGGKELVYIADASGRIKMFDAGDMDAGDFTTDTAPPLVWMSGRLFKENESMATYRPVRLKALSAGDSNAGLTWNLTGEEAHLDASYVDSAGAAQTTTSADRQDQIGTLILHPGGSDAAPLDYFYDETNNFAQWNAFKWTARDWSSIRLDAGAVKSKSVRFSVVDQGDTNRGPVLKLASFTIETDAGAGDTR